MKYRFTSTCVACSWHDPAPGQMARKSAASSTPGIPRIRRPPIWSKLPRPRGTTSWCAEPLSPNRFMPAAVAARPQATADGRRHRQIFPDRALLRDEDLRADLAAGIHADRLRDVSFVSTGGYCRNLRETLGWLHVQAVMNISDRATAAPYAATRRIEAMENTTRTSRPALA